MVIIGFITYIVHKHLYSINKEIIVCLSYKYSIFHHPKKVLHKQKITHKNTLLQTKRKKKHYI